MSIFTGIVDVSYNVTNWEQARNFYGETLGLPLFTARDDLGWAEYGAPNQAHLALSLWRGPDPVPPRNGGAMLIFGVMDAHAAVAELRKRGVKCDDVIVVPGVVAYAQFYDPEGNILQLAGMP